MELKKRNNNPVYDEIYYFYKCKPQKKKTISATETFVHFIICVSVCISPVSMATEEWD